IIGQSIRIDDAPTTRMGHQCFQLRAKQHSSIKMSVIKRFLADSVSQQPKRPRTAIPPCQRKHANQALGGCNNAKRLEGFEDYLGIRVATPANTTILELRSEFLGII